MTTYLGRMTLQDTAKNPLQNYLILQQCPAKAMAQMSKDAKQTAEPPPASVSSPSTGTRLDPPAQINPLLAGSWDIYAKTHSVKANPW